jgi:hypothetical protein
MKKLYVLLLLGFCLLPFAAANEAQVGLYIINMGKFDISTGSFTADFYLSMVCSEKCGDFEFMNGRATSIDKTIDEEKEKFYRIQGNFVSPVNLRAFPFDKQHIQITL